MGGRVHDFNLYNLFILSFVQLIVATVLVLSPARNLGTRFGWTGSRITEVVLGALSAAAVAALSCFLSISLWNLESTGTETGAFLITALCVVVIVMKPDTNVVGSIFYASFAAAGLSFLAFTAYVAVAATHSVGEAFTSCILIALLFAAFQVWNSNVNYVSDVLCRTRHSRLPHDVDPSYQPMVSLHIPAYNEPPEMLIATIKSVEQIDYPNFEIVVIDNNTADPAVWGPVEEYCRDRENVRFVHVERWPGYKAGACNLALRRYTDPRAEIIGLIDADDIVKPYYLKETVAHFSDPSLGFLQTFEGNRDYEGSKYYTACVDSYQAFYLAVMSSRQERDTVPFVGTMGLFRRSALEAIGGWNEWCISEDTEASLRVLKAGWSGVYVPRCFGRGLVPPTFKGLNTQRHRWCFGAMQILRLHWRSLMPWDRSPDNHLTGAQRRDYLMACMSWFRDLLMLVFALILLVITGLIVSGSHFALTPLGGARSLYPISLIVVATICMVWTLRHWTTISRRGSLRGLIISLSASWITALASVEGMTRREGVFMRTPKTGSGHHRVRAALRLTRWETVMATSLLAAVGVLSTLAHPPILLISICAVQGFVYACGPIAALWNVRAEPVPREEYRRRFELASTRTALRRRPAFTFNRIAVIACAAAAGVGIGAVVVPSSLVPTSAPPAHVRHVGTTNGHSAVPSHSGVRK